MFNDHRPNRELDDTAASAASDRLNELIRRVKAAGATISRDETTPLYIDFNMDEFKIGDRREVEFNLNKTDFFITQDIKTKRIGGTGNKTHLEDVSHPMIEMKLKRRPETSDQWLAVDIDELF